jgi:hypothetical protein
MGLQRRYASQQQRLGHTSWLIFVLSCSVMQLASAERIVPAAGQVAELNDTSFDAAVQQGAWLVDVYAPW